MSKFKAFRTVMLIILIVSLFAPIAFAQDTSSQIFHDVSVQSNTNSITINWEKVKDVKDYIILDEFGKKLYEGNETTFTISKLDSNAYSSYYLMGENKHGGLVTERVAITAKTKNPSGTEQGFAYMVTTQDYILLDWDPIPNIKGLYKIYRDGNLVTQTMDTEYKDTNIEHGNQYSYSMNTIVLATGLNQKGDNIEFDKHVSYQTIMDTSKISNGNDFVIQGSTDAYYPSIIFKTFIEDAKIYDPDDDCGADKSYFEGDGRSFSFSSTKYRTKQEMDIDFNSQTYSYSGNAGRTHSWCEKSDGTTYNHQYGYADMSRSYVSQVQFSGSNSVSFFMNLAANNPLVAGSPDIDADINFTVYKGNGVSTGTTSLSIDHDGFPAYEIYRQDGTLAYKALYTFSANQNNQNPGSLFLQRNGALL